MTRHEHVLAEANRRICAGESVVLATIIHIKGSSSQPLGSHMAVFADDSFLGSVSGGCVESDVANRAEAVREDSLPRIVEYHQVTDPLFGVGLNCDGSVMVLLEPASPELIGCLTTSRPGYVETRVEGLSAGLRGESVAVSRHAVATRAAGGPAEPSVTSCLEDDAVVLRQPVGLRSKLLIFGATDIATVLASLASRVGFDVTVSDPRATFADPSHHPEAGRVIAAWPQEVLKEVAIDEASFVVSLNHEPRFEDALFVALMEQPRPAYIGAIGKPERAREREARQQAAGFDLAKLPPVHTPIGIPIGGKSPEEIALSILAEIVAVRNGKDS